MQKKLKKVSAVILSLAMAGQFGLKDSYYVNANYINANDEQPAVEMKKENEASKSKSFSMMLAENANDTYKVELKSQDNSSLGTLSLNVGAITDNFKDGKITLNGKTYSFVEARVINSSNPTDYTPISYVAVYDGVTYYSTNSITGSPLEAGDSIVVILKEDVTQYAVNYKLIVDGDDKTANISDYITLEGNETSVDTDTSFSFLVKPNKGFTVASVTQDNAPLTADGTKYSTNRITANTTVTIALKEKKVAKIRLNGSNTTFKYNGNTENSTSDKPWVITQDFNTNTNSLSFELTGRLEWNQDNDKELNKVVVSLHDGSTPTLSKKSINIPTTPGQSVETQLTDDLKAKVTKGTEKINIGNNKYSYKYIVTLFSEKNIYDDIDISTNFKDATSRELFVTSTVGVSTITCGDQRLDPADSNSNFLVLNPGEEYTFKFKVLSGYIPDASKIKVKGTVDGETLDNVKVTKQSDGSFSFKIKAVKGKYDYRIQVVAKKSKYKLVYDAKGIDSSSKLDAGDHATITSKKPKKDKYVFNGWKIKGDPSKTIYSSKEVVNIDDLIAYSSWDANDEVSKITFEPTWLKADEAKAVGYTVLVHFDDGKPDMEYDGRTAPNKSVKVFKNELEVSLGIDTDYYYLNSDQALDMRNVKDGDVLEITYHVRKKLEVGTLPNVQYNGSTQKLVPNVSAKDNSSLVEGKDYTVSYSRGDYKNVTGEELTVTITGIGKYKGTYPVSYQIIKRPVTLKSASLEKVYDGTALVNGDTALETEEGWVKGEGATYSFTGTQTNAGSSKNAFTYTLKDNTKEGNYSITKNEGTLTVKPKLIVPDGPDTPEEKKTGITASDPSDSKYDGKEHREVLTVKDTKTDKILVADKDYSVTYSDDLVNAGTVTIKVAGLGNYTGSFEKTYKITKRSVTLTSADATKTYDGTALTNTSITVSGDGFAKGEGAEYKVTGTQTQVGKCVNEFEYTLNENTLASNYDITKVVGTLTVTAAPAPETPEKPSKQEKSAKPGNVATGDNTNIGIFMVAETLALAGLAVCVALARRKGY